MSATENHKPSYRHYVPILAGIAVVLILLTTQSQKLINNLYLRYIDYKWNRVELTGLTNNTELQDGFPDFWNARAWRGGRAEIRSESTEVHTGSYSALVERTSPGGVTALSQLLPVPEDAANVSLAVFAKGDGGAAQILYFFEGQQASVNGGWQDIPALGNWQQYQINKPLPPEVRQIEILLRSSGVTFFDDAEITFRSEAGESLKPLKNPGFEEDGLPQDPFVWWREHTVLPELGNIPQETLTGELPYLNMLDMLNGRYEAIRQRITQQETPCSTTPEMISWLLDLGQEVYDQGGPSSAEKLLQLAISIAPTCPQPYFQLGRLYELNGVYLSAAEQFRLAAELSGETPLAGYYYFNEGLIHVRHTGDLDQAIFTLEKAGALEAWVTGIVFQGASAYNLGLAYKNAGLRAEASDAFRRVIDCDACTYYHDAAAAELNALKGEQTN